MDNLTKSQRRKNMQNIRSVGTTPERKLAQSLHKESIYFSKNVASLPGKPDIVFRRKKVAVFVDSEFWHGHPKRFMMPKTNLSYWRPKIERNIQRDKLVGRILRKSGWEVLRFWECEIKKNTERCVRKIFKTLTCRKKRCGDPAPKNKAG